MLDKFRGIKPTHLWHHTSYKAFKTFIKDRYEARKNMEALFFKPRQNLALAGFVWTATLAFWYSIGAIDPVRIFKNFLPHECKPSSGPNMDVCKKQEPKPKVLPCPPPKKKEC